MIVSTDMIEKHDRNDNEEGGCHLCTIVTWHCIALAKCRMQQRVEVKAQ